jgi:hypothetical protein
MSFRLRLVALLVLASTALSACVVVPVPARRHTYVERPPAVIVAPYPRYRHHGGGRW